MLTKELAIQKYKECKLSRNGSIPLRHEFLEYAGIDSRQLAKFFGSSAYSKLQKAAGDIPNEWGKERTTLATIMNQYGQLVIEFGAVPPSSEWEYRDLKPRISGLAQKPHEMKWSELPGKFVKWVQANKVSGFDKAVEIISSTIQPAILTTEKVDKTFLRLANDIREWTPARRRNNEEAYKVELRGHLNSLKYEMNEEYGESKCDLLVQRIYAIEVKKDPDLGEYDRLFGQLARHLEHQCMVIVLILEATRNDKYDTFTALVDKYLNVNGNSVEIIKK